MIKKANAIHQGNRLHSDSSSGITYLKHAAEELDFLETGSVDLVVSGRPNRDEHFCTCGSWSLCSCLAQAAHWFDYTKLWPQLARVLRKDGSVAFWVRTCVSLSVFLCLTCSGRLFVNLSGIFCCLKYAGILPIPYRRVPLTDTNYRGVLSRPKSHRLSRSLLGAAREINTRQPLYGCTEGSRI